MNYLSEERMGEISHAIAKSVGRDYLVVVSDNGIVHIVKGDNSWVLAMASLDDDAVCVAQNVKLYIDSFPDKRDQWPPNEPVIHTPAQ